MGLWARRTLWEYWYRLWMVDRVGGYYGAAFKDFWGVTQGYPPPPNNFNMVVDAVVRHWISLVAGGEGGKDGWGKEVQTCAAFFYSDDDLVASTDLVWMQGVFDNLTGLTEWDFGKTLGRRSG